MKNQKLIGLAKSFAFLPIITMSMPFGGVPNQQSDIIVNPQVLLAQMNIEVPGLSTSNPLVDQEAKILEAKAKAIDDYFKARNMPLAGMGMKMVQEAEKNDLDWRLLPAISVIESTGGKFACKKVKHSFLGWGSCKINFESDEKAIEIVAWNLGGNNPNTDHHYKDKTTEEILKKYNSVIPTYTKKVFKVMESIGPKEIEPEIVS